MRADRRQDRRHSPTTPCGTPAPSWNGSTPTTSCSTPWRLTSSWRWASSTCARSTTTSCRRCCCNRSCPTRVDDIVVEFGNALYQDVADRFLARPRAGERHRAVADLAQHDRRAHLLGRAGIRTVLPYRAGGQPGAPRARAHPRARSATRQSTSRRSTVRPTLTSCRRQGNATHSSPTWSSARYWPKVGSPAHRRRRPPAPRRIHQRQPGPRKRRHAAVP